MTSALAVLKGPFCPLFSCFPLATASHLHCLFGARGREEKNGAIVQMKEKKNNSQPSSFFYQLPSLLLQRKHLVPSVPPEKRGEKKIGVRVYIPSANGDKEAASCHGPPDAGRLQVWMRGVLSGSHLDGETGCCSLKWLCWHEVSCVVCLYQTDF